MVFNPSGDRRCRIQQLGRSEPDDGDRSSVRSRCFCRQSAIGNVRRSLVAATMRSGHVHLTALVLHHAAAGALLGGQLRAGEHTGHCRCQACRQQQDQYPELAQYSHSSSSIPELRDRMPRYRSDIICSTAGTQSRGTACPHSVISCIDRD